MVWDGWGIYTAYAAINGLVSDNGKEEKRVAIETMDGHSDQRSQSDRPNMVQVA